MATSAKFRGANLFLPLAFALFGLAFMIGGMVGFGVMIWGLIPIFVTARTAAQRKREEDPAGPGNGPASRGTD